MTSSCQGILTLFRCVVRGRSYSHCDGNSTHCYYTTYQHCYDKSSSTGEHNWDALLCENISRDIQSPQRCWTPKMFTFYKKSLFEGSHPILLTFTSALMRSFTQWYDCQSTFDRCRSSPYGTYAQVEDEEIPSSLVHCYYDRNVWLDIVCEQFDPIPEWISVSYFFCIGFI